jgi:RES domain-containing protein
LRVAGRWHSAGRRVLYAAPNPAAAVLEVLVHVEVRRPEALQGYRLLELELAGGAVLAGPSDGELPPDWRTNLDATRALGDAWLARGDTLALGVPSVLVPATRNLLINPVHPAAARLRLVADHRFEWDPRLLGG